MEGSSWCGHDGGLHRLNPLGDPLEGTHWNGQSGWDLIYDLPGRHPLMEPLEGVHVGYALVGLPGTDHPECPTSRIPWRGPPGVDQL
jgi:hypothetical protein